MALRSVGWKALVLAAVSRVALPSEPPRDFRLPFSAARPLAQPGLSGPAARFFEANGRAWAVYWDERLETPRFLAPRAEVRIARPGMTDADLVEAAREFVRRNEGFFGVSHGDLLDPRVTPVDRHWLVGFSQGSGGVPLRGAGLRILIDPDGAIASVDCFLARASMLPDTPLLEWLDENEVLGKARDLTGAELGALGRQVVFPGVDPGSAVPGFCLEAEHPDGRTGELFFSAEGVYLGEWDTAQHFEGKLEVRGFSTDPDDIYSTANQANGYYPLPDLRVFAASGWRGLTDKTGTATFESPWTEDNVWPALSLGIWDWHEEPCLIDKDMDPAEALNEDGIKTVFMISIKDLCATPANWLPNDLYDANRKVPVDPAWPAVFTFEQGLNPRDHLRAFDLLVYHHVRKLYHSSNKRILDNRLSAAQLDLFPLRVLVSRYTDDFWLPRYSPGECNAHICIGQATSRQSWVPPTIVHHEYAHHVIRTLGGTSQYDDFVDGLADAITAYSNDNPRIGFITEELRGPLGFAIDDRDFLWNQNMRLKVGATFWQILANTREAERHLIFDLIYVWLAQRHTERGHQLAFDYSVLLEQLLVAAAALEGQGRISHPPKIAYAILAAFPDKGVFFTPFIRGDVDRSGGVDLSDAVAALNYLFLGGREDRCLDGMDADDSAYLDLGDPLTILTYLFLAGAPPAMPFPDCGGDPTDVDFWCSKTADICLGI